MQNALLQSNNAELRAQLGSYQVKFDEFGATLGSSNKMFETLRAELQVGHADKWAAGQSHWPVAFCICWLQPCCAVL